LIDVDTLTLADLIDGCQYDRGNMSKRKVEPTCCGSVLAAPLGDADAEDLARVFAALGDPVRLRLLSLVADAGEICSCDLMTPLGRSQPTVSHHTKVLADVGLIEGERRGRWVWWRVVPERMETVRDALRRPRVAT
jgi:ArsR family transcriptional regulator